MNLEILSIITTIGLALYIYSRNPRRAVYKGLAGFTLSLGLWGLSNYLNLRNVLLSTTGWMKVSFALFLLGINPFLIFAYFFPRKDNYSRYYLWHGLAYNAASLISLYYLLFTDHWITSTTVSPQGIKVSFGIAAYIWIAVMSISSALHFVPMGLRSRQVRGRDKAQMRLFGLSLIPFFLYTGSLSGRMIRQGSFVLSETSTFFLVPFVLINLYTIVRHRFLDMRIALKNIALKITLGLLLFTVIFVLQGFNRQHPPGLSNATFLLLSSLTFVFLYEPLMKQLRQLTNRYLFQKETTRAELLRKLNREMAESIDLQNLKTKIEATLQTVLQAKFSQFARAEESTLLKPFFKDHPGPIILDELKLDLRNPIYQRDDTSLELFHFMREKDIAALIPLMSKNNFVGLIYLGEKKNQEDFNENDLRILETLQYQAGIALENAQLIHQLELDKIILSAERNKLSVVLAGIIDGVIALDQDKSIVVFNQAAARITGWTSSEVLDQPIDQFFTLMKNEEDEISLSKLCPEKVSDEKDRVVFRSSDVLLKTKTGKLKPVSITSATIKESDFADVSYIFTFVDLSSERELERMKLDFVAMAAHELRTPLTSIMGYLSILREETSDQLTEEYLGFIDRAVDSGKRLSALMENLLSITRIEKGTMTTQPKPIRWAELIRNKIAEFQGRAEQRGLDLLIKKPAQLDHLPLVKADPLRISEVLNNLLDNAIIYTQQGQVTVFCEYQPKKNRVVTHIEDTGPGIPEESIPHLFEKFYRIAGPLEEGSKGTGLGLYISKEIVEMHGGEIWVESEEDRGTTFSFSLPAANNRAA